MRSRVTDKFIKRFQALPAPVKEAARQSFLQWRADPPHPGLRLKPLLGRPGVYAVRIGLNWRVLCRRDGDVMTWFWIGSHAEYDSLIG